MVFFSRISTNATPQNESMARLSTITIRLVVSNIQGDIWFTDLFLQGGAISSGWVGNVNEMKWTLDG